MILRFASAISLLPLLCAGQTVSPSSATSAPIHVLYRLFFRDVAAIDGAAADADAAGRPGGDKARAWYQGILSLSDQEIAGLKAEAAQCNKALDQHQLKAQPVIDAVRQQNSKKPVSAVPSPELAALEQERTAISTGCISDLNAGLGDKTFANIDVYVRTKFAQKVTATAPPGAPFGNAPTKPTGGGK